MFKLSFKTYNYKDLVLITNKIENIVKTKKLFNNIEIKRTTFLKSKNKIYTVLKSPHIYKKSREHFSFNNYKTTIFLSQIDLYIFLYFLMYIKTRIKQNFIIKTKICL